MAQTVAYTGTGRRKSSVARVRLVPGKGQITVNKKKMLQITFLHLWLFKI